MLSEILPVGNAWGDDSSYWTAETGFYDIATNWLPLGEPFLIVAEISNGGTATVRTTDNELSELYLGRSGGTSGSLSVLPNSWLVSGKIVVGDGGTGHAEITGPGSALTSNWLGGFVVGNFGTGTVNITAGGAAYSQAGFHLGVLPNSTGTVTVDGGDAGGVASKLSDEDGIVVVGDLGKGILNITGGGLVENGFGYIGNYGIESSVTVDGKDPTGRPSKWMNSQDLQVGGTGNGNLTVSGGGIVEDANAVIGRSSSSTGNIVEIRGTGSLWKNSGQLVIGDTGSGSVEIKDGGAVQNTIGYIAKSSSSSPPNVVTIDGKDFDGVPSKWTSSEELYVGYAGNGTITVKNGAVLENRSGIVGVLNSFAAGTSDGTVNVRAGSNWKNNGDLTVGFNGNGHLNITGGGTVESNHGYIGRFGAGFFGGASTGEVTIDTQSSKWLMHGDLTVGRSGNGALNVTHGAMVENTNGYIGRLNGSHGTVNLDGVWKNNGDLSLGGQGSGVLNVNHGTVKVANTLSVSKNGTVTLDGLSLEQFQEPAIEANYVLVLADGVLRGTGRIVAPLVANDGKIELDASLRKTCQAVVLPRDDYSSYETNLVINGDFRTTGQLSITGLSQAHVLEPQFTHSTAIVVDGTATLDGKLSVQFAPGYTPEIGNRFAIVTAKEIVGKIATFESAVLPGPDPQHPVTDKFLGLNYRRSTFNGSEPVLEVITLRAPRRLTPEPPAGTTPRNLLLVTHGTRDDTDGWVTELAQTMALAREAETRIGDWEVVTFDWRDYNGGGTDPFAKGLDPIGTFDPTGACNNAISIGESLVRWYQAQPNNRTFVNMHLLAHSAGTWLIDGMADALEGGPDENIQLTLFESFTPPHGIWGTGRVMADHGDFVDHYIHRHKFVPFTDQQFSNAVTIDLTQLDPDVGPVESHSYPYSAYRNSASTPYDPNNGGFGAGLSPLYTGNFPAYDSRMERGSLFMFVPPAAAKFGAFLEGINLFDQINVTTGHVEILPNGNGILRTSSPSILNSLIELEQPFWAFEFDFEFLSDKAGLFSVYFDGEQVFEFENAATGAGPGDMLTSGWIWLNEEHAPGPYSVTFRLDPLGAESAELEISNLQFISLVEALPGDFNGDHVVDAADYVMWRKTDGSQTGYDTWRANFGRTTNSASGSAEGSAIQAVPEPGNLLLAFVAVLALTAARARRVR